MPFGMMIGLVLIFGFGAAISEIAQDQASGAMLWLIILAKWAFTSFIALVVLIQVGKTKP